MQVQLYVYDLSGGLARNLSAALLGIQVDAVYHTSIVMGGIEYTYDGGIKTINPGSSHLGQQMQTLDLGETNLPMDIIIEYLDSLRGIYTAAAYDIWTHNCNNFSNDFATFLLGKGIPDHITNLPQTVLNTPFGRMIRPRIEQMVESQRQNHGGLLGIKNMVPTPQTHQQAVHSVKRPESSSALKKLLTEAEKSCAVVFFTSKNCQPCKAVYPLYDQLAAEVGQKATLIIVDISKSFEIGSSYNVRATPTFVTFLHGKEENRWTGGDPNTLRGNIRLLTQMAWPSHPHESLPLATLRKSGTKPVLYNKLPPLSKLRLKMGDVAENAAVAGVLEFIAAGKSEGAAETTLPNLDLFSKFLTSAPFTLPPEILFTIVDLLRVALLDPRFSGYYAEEKDHATVVALLSFVNSMDNCPYSLRLVTLQMACNLFSSPLYPQHILGCPTLTNPIVTLTTMSLLDDKHPSVRVAAASLAFNVAAANSRLQTEEHQVLFSEDNQIEFAASLLEAISVEQESAEAFKGLLLAFGYLVYCSAKHGELINFLETMDAKGTITEKKKLFQAEALIVEIGQLLQ